MEDDPHNNGHNGAQQRQPPAAADLISLFQNLSMNRQQSATSSSNRPRVICNCCGYEIGQDPMSCAARYHYIELEDAFHDIKELEMKASLNEEEEEKRRSLFRGVERAFKDLANAIGTTSGNVLDQMIAHIQA